MALDSAGGNHGTLMADATWTEGMIGGAVYLDGDGDYVDCGNDASFNIVASVTLAAWVQPDPDSAGTAWSGIIMRGGPNIDTFAFYYRFSSQQLGFKTTGTDPGPSWMALSATGLFDGEWHHAAAVYDGSAKIVYLDAQELARESASGSIETSGGRVLLGAGRDTMPPTLFAQGKIDDARIYARGLSVADIELLMTAQDNPPGVALDPQPADQAQDVPVPVTLTWRSGEFARTHHVYLGMDFTDVNAADVGDPRGVLAGQDLDVNRFEAGRLDFGQTYFWHADEVNGAPDHTVIKGSVWEFTVEPFAYPVQPIAVTASSANGADMGPENTINGVGLNEQDQHSTEATEMWLSGMGDATPSIQYEFDKAYKLHEMWVWNSNQLIEAFLGIGAKDVVIEHSLDGVEWVALGDVHQFAQAPGNATYTANTTIDLGGVLTRFVRITVHAGWGMLPQFGISEVRFHYIPTSARQPQPADDAITSNTNVQLAWRAGREAASHEVYLGTDPAKLDQVGSTREKRFDAGTLNYDTSYYWQIIDVNDNETPSSYAGPIWRFDTPAFAVVDNFDQYNDNCNRIFFAWEDGLGHSGGEDIDKCDVAPSNGNGGGSIVGHSMAPFAERSIVAAGSQSLPFSYDNAFGPSEAMLTLDGQDWSASGIQSLSLMFYGSVGNTGQLYVKVNNSKVTYDGDPANMARAEWQAWVIDLSQVGGNLQNVTSLTIGVDGANAAGMLYIDEIGLYPRPAEYITPVDPGNANLAGHWPFDEGAGTAAADASGNGNDGTLISAGWIPGQISSAVGFDGLRAYVDIPAAAWNTIEQQVTVAAWMYVDSSLSQNPFTMAAFQDAGDGNTRVFSNHLLWGNTLYLDTGGGSDGYDRISKPAVAADYADAWIHWAFTKNAQTGEQKIYRNGALWHSGTGLTRTMTGVTVFILGANAAATGEFWNGSMDDLRLYNKALSPEETLWLAGRTTPVTKPF